MEQRGIPYEGQCPGCHFWRVMLGVGCHACHYLLDNDERPRKTAERCYGYEPRGKYRPRPLTFGTGKRKGD